MARLGEILTAIVTPLRADGSVDLDRFAALAQHLVEHGSDGLVVTGTTGEAPTLGDDEKVELWRTAVDAVGGRATVVAGTGTYSTAHSVHLTERATDAGVDGVLVVTPYYNKPPPRGIVEHFRAVAAATDRPVVVYNIPQRVVVNIEPDTICELAEIPGIAAVKQATTDPDQARRILAETDLELYAGNDDQLLPFRELGGAGGILVYTHLVGPQVKELVRRFRAGDAAGAQALDAELHGLIDALAVTTNPIGVKAALNLLGHEVGGLRLPLVEASDGELAVVRAGLERVGLLTAAAA
jgi:4-hydroxy-tetrahydrodipicolinate synthase